MIVVVSSGGRSSSWEWLKWLLSGSSAQADWECWIDCLRYRSYSRCHLVGVELVVLVDALLESRLSLRRFVEDKAMRNERLDEILTAAL